MCTFPTAGYIYFFQGHFLGRKKKKLLGLYGDSFRLKATSFLFINLKKNSSSKKKRDGKERFVGFS